MEIKTEFESFMAIKASEFFKSKTSLDIRQMRSLIEIIDDWNLDIENVPVMVTVPKTTPISAKSLITGKDIENYIIHMVSKGMVTRAKLYADAKEYFGNKLTSADYKRSARNNSKSLNTRIYMKTYYMKTNGKLTEIVVKDGNTYLHLASSLSSKLTENKATN